MFAADVLRILPTLVEPSLMQTCACLQVLLARHKETTKYYAVKVLQKKIIMKKKEVRRHTQSP